jgi:hypothetical protein
MKMILVYSILVPYDFAVNSTQSSKFLKPKDTPPTYDLDLEFTTVHESQLQIQDYQVSSKYVVIEKSVLAAEFRYELNGGFDNRCTEIKNKLNAELKERFFKEISYQGAVTEEYLSILLVQSKGKPSSFLERNKYGIAKFIRSIDKRVSEDEVAEILTSQVKYSESYLALVDWEASLLINDTNDFQDDLDLFLIGNYQVLRYRMIDQATEKHLETVYELVTAHRRQWLPSKRLANDILQTQLELLLDFDRVDQSLLMVGEWYSSKLYKIIADEFSLPEWKAVVKEKLQTLADIEETVTDKLSLSWDRFWDVIQLIGWMVLLVGYFVLFYIDVT